MPRNLVALIAAALALTGFAACGETGGTTGTETIIPETGVDPGSGSQNFSVALNGSDGGQIGSANLTGAAGEQVRVTIQVDTVTEESLPAVIRPGTCADEHGDEGGELELSEIENGRSETLVDVSMAELRTEAHALVVGEHRGREEYLACGDIGDASGGG